MWIVNKSFDLESFPKSCEGIIELLPLALGLIELDHGLTPFVESVFEGDPIRSQMTLDDRKRFERAFDSVGSDPCKNRHHLWANAYSLNPIALRKTKCHFKRTIRCPGDRGGDQGDKGDQEAVCG